MPEEMLLAETASVEVAALMAPGLTVMVGKVEVSIPPFTVTLMVVAVPETSPVKLLD